MLVASQYFLQILASCYIEAVLTVGSGGSNPPQKMLYFTIFKKPLLDRHSVVLLFFVCAKPFPPKSIFELAFSLMKKTYTTRAIKDCRSFFVEALLFRVEFYCKTT